MIVASNIEATVLSILDTIPLLTPLEIEHPLWLEFLTYHYDFSSPIITEIFVVPISNPTIKEFIGILSSFFSTILSFVHTI